MKPSSWQSTLLILGAELNDPILETQIIHNENLENLLTAKIIRIKNTTIWKQIQIQKQNERRKRNIN